MELDYQESFTSLKGGPGSGNFGHAGRPGKRGGSAPKSSFSREALLKLGVNEKNLYGHYTGTPKAQAALMRVLKNGSKIEALTDEVAEEKRRYHKEHLKFDFGSDEAKDFKKEHEAKLKTLENKMVDLVTSDQFLGKFSGTPFKSLMVGSDWGEDQIDENIKNFLRFGDLGDKLTVGFQVTVWRNGFRKLGSTEVMVEITPSRTASMFHELGHAMEHKGQASRNAVIDFFNKRTEGKELKSMNEAPDKGTDEFYDDSEKYYADTGFIRSYTGKPYPSKDTELMSTGMEEMLKDGGYTLAKHDPEHWLLVYDVMRGNI